jgi:hypothetical protein
VRIIRDAADVIRVEVCDNDVADVLAAEAEQFELTRASTSPRPICVTRLAESKVARMISRAALPDRRRACPNSKPRPEGVRQEN